MSTTAGPSSITLLTTEQLCAFLSGGQLKPAEVASLTEEIVRRASLAAPSAVLALAAKWRARANILLPTLSGRDAQQKSALLRRCAQELEGALKGPPQTGEPSDAPKEAEIARQQDTPKKEAK